MEASIIKGETTAYARVCSVRSDIPIAEIEHTSGHRSVLFFQDEHRPLVRVDHHIRIEGQATWDGRTMKMNSIDAHVVAPFQNIGADETFEILAKHLGPAWAGIDPDVYFAEERDEPG